MDRYPIPHHLLLVSELLGGARVRTVHDLPTVHLGSSCPSVDSFGGLWYTWLRSHEMTAQGDALVSTVYHDNLIVQADQYAGL